MRTTLKRVFAVAVLLVTPGSVLASQPGEFNLEVYGGWYLAGDLQALNELPGDISESLEALGLEPSDDVTWGVRGGRRHSDRWGWQVTLGRFDVDEALERLEDRESLSLNLVVVDASLVYYPGGGNLLLYGGPGMTVAELELSGPLLGNVDESNTSLSLHAGVGYNIGLGDSAYLRLDGRLRYIDTDYYGGGVDGELTAALGWSF